MRPVCVKCGVEMLCTKTGRTVAPRSEPRWSRSGDEFTCGTCGTKIVVGFGAAHEAQVDADVLLEG
jgi:DNA-directed RNA polymerase subunit RPC12/RpoP